MKNVARLPSVLQRSSIETDSNDKIQGLFWNCSNLQIRLSLPKLLILVLWVFTRKFNVNYCGYDIIFRSPRAVRFAIQHSLQKNSLLHCLLQEFSFLRKELPILVARISEIEIIFKIIRCNAFLLEEFPSIKSSCKNLDSPWKNRNKIILVIRI